MVQTTASGDGSGNGTYPRVGDPAPDAALVDSEDSAVRISTLWREKPLVLVFLRHLGCTFCRQQLAWLARDYQRFAAAGANVACVAQGDAKVGKAYVLLLDLPFPLLLCGNDLAVYRQYGLTQANVVSMLNPVMIFKGLASLLQGHKQTEVIGDGRQLGGAFLIDRTGTVRYIHRNADPSDNAKNDQLLDALASIGNPGRILGQ
jgi:peroxiredoxin